MNKFFKRLLRRPAIIIVVLWSKLAFDRGVEAAINRHRRTGKVVYLAADSFRRDHLITYVKEQFKAEKRIYGVAARLLTMQTLRRDCYYYTCDKYGQRGMSEAEYIRRRKAFIAERLRLSGLR